MFFELIRKDSQLKTYLACAFICIIANILVTSYLRDVVSESVHFLLMVVCSFSALNAASSFAHRYAQLHKEQEDQNKQ